MVKNLPAHAGDARDAGSIPGLGRTPGVENGNPLQYSCLGNSTDRGAWWATVHGAAKSWTRLEKLSTKALRDKQDPALFAEDVYLVGERAILHVSSIMLKSVQISLRVQKKGSVQCSRSRKPSARRSHLAPCQEEKAVGRTWGQEAEKVQSRPRQDAESLAAEPGAIWVQVTELGCRACWAELFAEGLV